MPDKKIRPPKLGEYFLKKFLREDLAEDVLGDLEECFYYDVVNKSTAKAKWIYWYQVFNYLRPFAIKKSNSTTLNQITMLRHFLKISWRSILRQKVFSTIEIGGFSVGIAACILISLYIGHQLSYDNFYKDQDQIYRVVNQWAGPGDEGYWTNVHGPLKEVFEDNIPEMESVARVVFWSWGNAGENHIRKSEASFNSYEDGFIYADPEILEILEIPLVYGRKGSALTAPNSVVISKKIADKYFNGMDPVGMRMVLNDKIEDTYVIGGVMENRPTNSHFQTDFILTLAERKSGPGTSGWCCTNYTIYTKLHDHTDKYVVQEKTATLRNSFVLDKLQEDGQGEIEEMRKYQSYYLQAVEDVYLNPEEVGDFHSHGSMDLIVTFGFIAIIVLVIAAINFVNLATARSLKRAKEVGLRKVVGSFRTNLVYQYLVESVFYSLLAVFLGVTLAWIVLPSFNLLAESSLEIPWSSIWFIPTLLALGLVIGIFSGLYPAIYLSGFRIVDVLKGSPASGRGKSTLRSGMVVFQFAATVILITGALVTHKQFELIMNSSLGYNKDQVINILGLESMDERQRDLFKDELKRLPKISNATSSDYLPVEGGSIQNRSYWIENRRFTDNGLEAAHWFVDEDYVSTMGMEIIEGRNFDNTSRDDVSIIINERMVTELNLETPIGSQLIDMFDYKYNVIGVVKDFYFESFLGDVRPLVFVKGNGRGTVSAKIEGSDVQSALTSIELLWNKINPNQSIRYRFMDNQFAKMYDGLHRAKTIFLVFSVLSISVACMGLFALSMFMMEQRGKEISVRKVLGASSTKLYTLLTIDFMKLVLIAIGIAIPISWYFTQFLLDGMVNRIAITWELFAFSGAIALLIAMITISYESLKATLVNPAKKLRSE